jgi:hypothetical protein
MKMFYKLLLRNNGYSTGELRSKDKSLPVLEPCSGTVSNASSGLSSILRLVGDKPNLPHGKKRNREAEGKSCPRRLVGDKPKLPHGEKRKREAEGKLSVDSVHVPVLSFNLWQGKVMPMDTLYCHVCYARHVRGPRMAVQVQGHPDRCLCDETESMIVGALHLVRARTPYKDTSTGNTLVSAHQVPLDPSILVHPSAHRPIYTIHSTRRWSPSDPRSP